MIPSVTDSFCSPNSLWKKRQLRLVHLIHLLQHFADTSPCFSSVLKTPYFSLPELSALFNNCSGLSYTLGGRKDKNTSTSHHHVPACWLHRPVGSPGSSGLAVFPEALAVCMHTPTQSSRGQKENTSYYVPSEFTSSGHKYLHRAPLSHQRVEAWTHSTAQWHSP